MVSIQGFVQIINNLKAHFIRYWLLDTWHFKHLDLSLSLSQIRLNLFAFFSSHFLQTLASFISFYSAFICRLSFSIKTDKIILLITISSYPPPAPFIIKYSCQLEPTFSFLFLVFSFPFMLISRPTFDLGSNPLPPTAVT